MSTSSPRHLLPPNPETQADHRRQMILQIWLPLGISILIVLILGGLSIASATGSGETVARWANISFIVLIMPALGIGLVFLVLNGGLAYLIARLVKITPSYTRVVQLFFQQISWQFKSFGNKVVNPFIQIQSIWAGIKTFHFPWQSPRK